MVLQSAPGCSNAGQISFLSPLLCPCKLNTIRIDTDISFCSLKSFSNRKRRRRRVFKTACLVSPISSSARRTTKVGDNLNYGEEELEEIQLGSNSKYTSFQEDPLVDKLRTQLGVIHPIPSPPINRNIVGLFVFFFFVGVVFDKVWTSRKRNKSVGDSKPGIWPQVPTSFSLFLEKDLQRKESVEWVNMVLGKLWKVYRGGLENWIIGLLQPVIDDLKKPDYVERVEIKQFSLGDEPLSVRNVERRTSRRVNDLQ